MHPAARVLPNSKIEEKKLSRLTEIGDWTRGEFVRSEDGQREPARMLRALPPEPP